MAINYNSILLLSVVCFSAMLASTRAQEGQNPISINVEIDPLQIAEAIKNAVNDKADRTSFVNDLMESTFQAAGRNHNVMVFNLAENYDYSFNEGEVVFYGSAPYGGLYFGIWAFGEGEFTNKGDGGYINWAFRGWYDYDDGSKHVSFHNPGQDELLFLSWIRWRSIWIRCRSIYLYIWLEPYLWIYTQMIALINELIK